MTYKIHTGDNRQILKTLADNSIDAIVTDPPYGIDFLGKAWDANTGALETYEECLRVLKPGGHILAFSAARTYHHLAITLESAGFEIRDQIMWIYSSGFPKSQDIGKSIQRSLGVEETKKATGPKSTTPRKNNYKNTLAEAQGNDRIISDDYDDVEIVVVTDPEAQAWQGWGTQLKPAHEPICLARKPIKQSIAKNCQEWGTGALNIDAARVPYEGDKPKPATYKNGISYREHTEELYEKSVEHATERVQEYNEAGRFPSNVLGDIAEEYQKYFYCPKVSRQERHIGFPEDSKGANIDANTHGKTPFCDDCQKTFNGSNDHSACDPALKTFKEKRNQNAPDGNNHPTVKPVELMKYLIKLITPPGGTVLDPFNGSGTTGMAAVELGFDYIGCELDPAYVEISLKRIEAWRNRDYHADVFDDLFTFGD
jgi:DNA modification methylase